MGETVFVGNWTEVGISRTSGKVKVFCPKCRDDRKDKSDHSLSVDLDKGVGHCHYCNTSFALEKPPERMKSGGVRKNYALPKWKGPTELSDKAVKYFGSRNIGRKTLERMKITEGMEFMPQAGKACNTIQFNYFRNGEMVNVKYRTGDKKFKLAAGAELIPYNLDAIRGLKECIVTEGEFDCLTFVECGFPHTVSVPNGASENTSYLDGCWDEYFEDKETVYIAVDTDRKGLVLRNELVRRFGAERCRIVTYGEDCKDANELHVKRGVNAVREAIRDAEEIKVEGVFSVSDFEEELDLLYENGLQRGLTIGLAEFDRLCSFETKRICVVTGIPGHGKSEFIDEIVERMNVFYGWKAAYFSPENFPLKYHASKLAGKLAGQPMRRDRMTPDEYRRVKEYMNENFFFILPEESFSVDTILDKGLYLVRRHGVKILVIDPWNRLEHQIPAGMSETNYISRTLDRFTNFVQRNDVLLFLAAHPRKMVKNTSGHYEMPTLYDINGSANFYNKADYGLSVHRDRVTDTVSVGVLKVKFRHLGEQGYVMFKYNVNNGRYTPYENGVPTDWDNSDHLTVHLGRTETEAGKQELPFEAYDGSQKAPF
jgi:twinkle protein